MLETVDWLMVLDVLSGYNCLLLDGIADGGNTTFAYTRKENKNCNGYPLGFNLSMGQHGSGFKLNSTGSFANCFGNGAERVEPPRRTVLFNLF